MPLCCDAEKNVPGSFMSFYIFFRHATVPAVSLAHQKSPHAEQRATGRARVAIQRGKGTKKGEQ